MQEDRPLRINPNPESDESPSASNGGGGGGGTHVVLVPFFPAPRPGGRFRGPGEFLFSSTENLPLSEFTRELAQQYGPKRSVVPCFYLL